jgi:hypothetical protein
MLSWQVGDSQRTTYYSNSPENIFCEEMRCAGQIGNGKRIGPGSSLTSRLRLNFAPLRLLSEIFAFFLPLSQICHRFGIFWYTFRYLSGRIWL